MALFGGKKKPAEVKNATKPVEEKNPIAVSTSDSVDIDDLPALSKTSEEERKIGELFLATIGEIPALERMGDNYLVSIPVSNSQDLAAKLARAGMGKIADKLMSRAIDNDVRWKIKPEQLIALAKKELAAHKQPTEDGQTIHEESAKKPEDMTIGELTDIIRDKNDNLEYASLQRMENGRLDSIDNDTTLGSLTAPVYLTNIAMQNLSRGIVFGEDGAKVQREHLIDLPIPAAVFEKLLTRFEKLKARQAQPTDNGSDEITQAGASAAETNDTIPLAEPTAVAQTSSEPRKQTQPTAALPEEGDISLSDGPVSGAVIVKNDAGIGHKAPVTEEETPERPKLRGIEPMAARPSEPGAIKPDKVRIKSATEQAREKLSAAFGSDTVIVRDAESGSWNLRTPDTEGARKAFKDIDVEPVESGKRWIVSREVLDALAPPPRETLLRRSFQNWGAPQAEKNLAEWLGINTPLRISESGSRFAIDGIPEGKLPSALADKMHDNLGKPLSREEGGKLLDKIEAHKMLATSVSDQDLYAKLGIETSRSL